jgi:tetratricopeptide (TPR) repeat protein
VFLAVLVVGFSGCAGRDNTSKIPITTSSDVALRHFLDGRELFWKFRYPAALEKFEQAAAADPDFALAHLYMAVLQPTAEQTQNELQRALDRSDYISDGERLFIFGVKAGTDGLRDKQGEYYRQMVAAYPEDEYAHYTLGNYYLVQREYDQAIASYEASIAIAPDFFEPYNELGYVYKILEDYPKSEAAFKRYIDLLPGESNPYDSYAELLMKMGRFEESIEIYQKALEVNPEFVTTYIGIATDLNLLGRHHEAREQARKLFDSAHNDGERRLAVLAGTISYVSEGKMVEALAELERRHGIAETMGDPNALAEDLTLMGHILLEIGEIDQASESYEHAVALVRESQLSAEAKDAAERMYVFNATRVALARNDIAAARAGLLDFQRLIQAVGDPLLVRLGHQLAGEIALAEEDYQTAVTELSLADQENPYNIYRLALAYRGSGDDAKARALAQRAADYYIINNLDYALVRAKAKALYGELSQ